MKALLNTPAWGHNGGEMSVVPRRGLVRGYNDMKMLLNTPAWGIMV